MIELPWPPTVNHYYTVARGRKILSTRGRKYKEQAWLHMLAKGRPVGAKGLVSVFIRAYPPDKRKRDLDNLLKPILDVLTLSGMIEDDSLIEDLRIQRFNPVKHGKVEVIISEQD